MARGQEGTAEGERRRGGCSSSDVEEGHRAATNRRRGSVRRVTRHLVARPRRRARRRSCSSPPEPMDPKTCSTSCTRQGRPRSPRASCTRRRATSSGWPPTHHYIFDIKPDSVYWCAADVGWVTGHSYIVYGPLTNGTTGVIYEGVPNYPEPERWWEIVERYKVDILYTAPTAIRSHMKWGPEHAAKHDLSSCGCSVPSESRSTPRPGSGTASISAATAARSWIRGGRRRPA